MDDQINTTPPAPDTNLPETSTGDVPAEIIPIVPENNLPFPEDNQPSPGPAALKKWIEPRIDGIVEGYRQFKPVVLETVYQHELGKGVYPVAPDHLYTRKQSDMMKGLLLNMTLKAIEQQTQKETIKESPGVNKVVKRIKASTVFESFNTAYRNWRYYHRGEPIVFIEDGPLLDFIWRTPVEGRIPWERIHYTFGPTFSVAMPAGDCNHQGFHPFMVSFERNFVMDFCTIKEMGLDPRSVNFNRIYGKGNVSAEVLMPTGVYGETPGFLPWEVIESSLDALDLIEDKPVPPGAIFNPMQTSVILAVKILLYANAFPGLCWRGAPDLPTDAHIRNPKNCFLLKGGPHVVKRYNERFEENPPPSRKWHWMSYFGEDKGEPNRVRCQYFYTAEDALKWKTKGGAPLE